MLLLTAAKAPLLLVPVLQHSYYHTWPQAVLFHFAAAGCACLVLQLNLSPTAAAAPAHLQTGDGSPLPVLLLQQLLCLKPALRVNGPAVDTNTIVLEPPPGINSEVSLEVGVAVRLGEPV